MPEGDTLHIHAHLFGLRYVGRSLFTASRAGVHEPAFGGAVLDAARPIGKHLLLDFEGRNGEPLRIRVHLGIAGKWRPGPPSSFAAEARRASPLCLDFGDEVAFVHRSKEVIFEQCTPVGEAALDAPDLLADAPDYAEIIRRARDPRFASRPIGELLLAQRVAPGVGNVYKSEACFLEAQHPFRRVDEVDDATLERIYRRAARLLRSDRDSQEAPPPPDGDRTWVYGRGGRSCFRCTTPIERRSMGPDLRGTFYCPRCQA
jgi:endonuclease-8